MLDKGKGKPLPEVRYVFKTHDVENTEWRVLSFRLHEEISELYVLTLDLVSELDDPSELMDTSVSFEIHRNIPRRAVHGIVTHVEELGHTDHDQVHCRVTVMPAMAALGTRENCRVWVDHTAIEIVRIVVNEEIARYGREIDTSRLNLKNYLKRESCTQYNETNLDYVKRLLHDEGVTFVFRERDGREVITLLEEPKDYARTVTMDFRARLPIMPTQAESAAIETVQRFHKVRTRGSTTAMIRDRDATRPEVDLTQRVPGLDMRGHEHESFRYEPSWTHAEYDAQGLQTHAAHDGAKRAQHSRERMKMHAETGAGWSNACALEPGMYVTIGDKEFGQPEEKVVITAIEHEGEAPEVLRGGGAVGYGNGDAHGATHKARYKNRFKSGGMNALFRPKQPPKRPKIYGLLTATVVGLKGHEIHTDEHGRVKVQFHFDRYGKNDEKSFAWVRVAQMWSGPGWGTQFIPRIGMEVLVAFEDGNPDRPIATGCVYNGTNRFPYVPHERPTVSTIKTQSAEGGNEHQFNELRFEDARGNEEVYLHAERDFNEKVERNHTRTVDAHETICVGASQSIAVTGNQTIQVLKGGGGHEQGSGGDRTLFVEHDHFETVERNKTVDVHRVHTEVVGEQRRAFVGVPIAVADQDAPPPPVPNPVELLLVNGSRFTDVRDTDKTLVAEHYLLQHQGSRIEARNNAMLFESPNEIRLRVGDSEIVIGPQQIQIKSPEIQLLGGVSPSSVGSTLTLNTTTATMQSAHEVHLYRGKKNGLLLQTAAQLKGADVQIANSGGALIELVSSVVKINS